MKDEPILSGPPRSGTGDCRCDAGADERARPRADWDRVPTFFRERANEPPVERRREPRHPAVEYRAWMGWWQNTHDFLVIAARLMNISRGGAMLVLTEAPPLNESVWVCLGLPEPVECASATVLEVTKTKQDSEHAVRFAFHTACSESFFQTAIHGLAREACPGGLAQRPGEAAAPPG